jgi:hypothetical protein
VTGRNWPQTFPRRAPQRGVSRRPGFRCVGHAGERATLLPSRASPAAPPRSWREARGRPLHPTARPGQGISAASGGPSVRLAGCLRGDRIDGAEVRLLRGRPAYGGRTRERGGNS